MKLIYSDYAIAHMMESIEVTCAQLSPEKRDVIADRVFAEAERLMMHPHAGQVEIYMDDRAHQYRRLVVGNFKIIYRIDGEWIRVTDIFDARQDPRRMRG